MVYFQQVHSSLVAWCRYLDRPRVAVRAVFALLIIHTGLLAYSAYVHSPTLNEPGHLVAGLSHWKFGRFELYRVNPPLVRMVAALPVMAVGYEEDWSGFYEEPGARPVFGMGEDFVAANGEHSFFLFMIARWACIPFSWLGAIVCYLWARDLFGRPSGVMACLLWCFSPNILGHAALITADVHATSLGIAACYTFWHWLKKPTWTQATLTGCVLGLAELAKTTLILFYPLWPLLWILYRWLDRKAVSRKTWFREAGMLLLRMAIGLYILNIGYGFEDTLKPLKEFHFVSNLFAGSDAEDESLGSATEVSAAATPKSINRFSTTWLGKLPVPFPKNYLTGIDLQQKDFEDFGRPSYLRGEFQEHGWWYYYLYALTVKVPVGTWLLAVFTLLWNSLRSDQVIQWRDILILLLPPLLIFVVVSSKNGFSHHMRYVFPCFPFVFIWLSQITAAISGANVIAQQRVGQFKSFVSAGGSLALTWLSVSSLSIYPHSISYFNELGGGPIGGPKHLINSNVDWGQDLRYLKWWKDNHKSEIRNKPFHLAYFGSVSPSELEFADALPWPTSRRHSDSEIAESQAAELPPGYYAISVNLLHGFPWDSRDGQAAETILQKPILKHFCSMKPFTRLGYSIQVFYISSNFFKQTSDRPEDG